MAEKKNIYEKLAEVRKAVEVVQKDSTGYGYNYVSDRELLALISGTMETNHLTLIPRITPGTTKVEPWTYIKNKLHPKTKELYDEVNNEVIVSAEMTYTWVNNDDPNETVEVPLDARRPAGRRLPELWCRTDVLLPVFPAEVLRRCRGGR